MQHMRNIVSTQRVDTQKAVIRAATSAKPTNSLLMRPTRVIKDHKAVPVNMHTLRRFLLLTKIPAAGITRAAKDLPTLLQLVNSPPVTPMVLKDLLIMAPDTTLRERKDRMETTDTNATVIMATSASITEAITEAIAEAVNDSAGHITGSAHTKVLAITQWASDITDITVLAMVWVTMASATNLAVKATMASATNSAVKATMASATDSAVKATMASAMNSAVKATMASAMNSAVKVMAALDLVPTSATVPDGEVITAATVKDLDDTSSKRYAHFLPKPRSFPSSTALHVPNAQENRVR